MARYCFHITAEPKDNCRSNIVLVKKVCPLFPFSPFSKEQKTPIHNWLKENFPFFEWTIDDGVDVNGTAYCVYVAQLSDDAYLLASVQEISEELFNNLSQKQ